MSAPGGPGREESSASADPEAPFQSFPLEQRFGGDSLAPPHCQVLRLACCAPVTTTDIRIPQVFFLNTKTESRGFGQKRENENHLILFFLAKTRKTLLIASSPSHVRKFMPSESLPCHLHSEV